MIPPSRALAVPAILAFAATTALAGGARPTCDDIAAFVADPPEPSGRHFRGFTVGRDQLCVILATYHAVTAEHWGHGYGHVAFGDRTGTFTLKDGTSYRWFVKPGGLATVAYPDGSVLHLAREK